MDNSLTEAVLSLPGRVEEAREKISDTYEFVADPPDFDEYFQERRLQYAELELYAARTALALRSHAKLPLRLDRGWDVEAYLTAQQTEIESRRQLNARLRAESFASFGRDDTPE